MPGIKIPLPPAAGDDLKHDKSSISFPYLDLSSAVDLAKAAFNRAGHGGCAIDELAAEMKQTVSGAFRLKIATAKTFGLLERESRGLLKLSDLGQKIVSAATEAEARATAFMNVPLYAAIYEKYRGHLLPPPKALEREMGALGVAPKQTEKARQIFTRSAEQAGFFAQGEDRLVQPRFDRIPLTKPVDVVPAPSKPNDLRGGGGGGDNTNKPLEYQLIDLLKAPNIGETEQAAIWTLVRFLSSKNEDDRSAA